MTAALAVVSNVMVAMLGIKIEVIANVMKGEACDSIGLSKGSPGLTAPIEAMRQGG